MPRRVGPPPASTQQDWSFGQRCNSLSNVKPSAGKADPGSATADLAGALHEVSNSLTVVLGWLIAAGEKLDKCEAREAIEIALAHARLGHSVARRAIGADVQGVTVARSALSIARDAVLGVSREAHAAGVRVQLSDRIEDDLVLAAAPITQQILINLLLNAIHFAPPRSEIVLAVTGTLSVVSFRVIDQGPGIAAERAESLFEAPVSTRPGGAGIGLRHAHSLAVEHGGTLRLARTSAAGTEFELLWPITDAPSSALRAAPPQALDGLRVLLLEDDPAVQSLIDLGLTNRGAAVAVASSARDITSLIVAGVFDVALVDLSPLGDNPGAVLALLSERHPGMPVVVISGSVAPDVQAPNIAAWVRKPFEVGELVQTLLRLRATG